MIKAIFFDWLNTIARLEPERHEIYSQILSRFGFEVSPERLIRGIYNAETQVPAGPPYRWSDSVDPEVFLRYQDIILSEVGIRLSRETALAALKAASQEAKKVTYVLYDDVLPTLKELKKRGLVLGLLSNLYKDVDIILGKLDLEPYLDFVVTSGEVGADKPQPPIFLAALERAGVSASEAVYVGDQYETDVVGARRVGIKPILIDRFNLESEVSDCLRIQSLVGLAQHL